MLHYAMSNDLSIIMFDFYLGMPHIMKTERSKRVEISRQKKLAKNNRIQNMLLIKGCQPLSQARPCLSTYQCNIGCDTLSCVGEKYFGRATSNNLQTVTFFYTHSKCHLLQFNSSGRMGLVPGLHVVCQWDSCNILAVISNLCMVWVIQFSGML